MYEHTEVDGFHGDAGRVLAIALLIQLDHLAAAMMFRRMQCVQLALVRAQLLNCACAKGVAGGDEYAQAVLDQPEADL